jgi:iron complex outermembrane receptor protein
MVRLLACSSALRLIAALAPGAVMAQSGPTPGVHEPRQISPRPPSATWSSRRAVAKRPSATCPRRSPPSASTNWRPRARSKASATCYRPVPGVRFNGLQSENLAEVSVRGSGTQRATSADSGVGLFVNGAYVGSSTLGGRNFKRIDYFDLSRDRGAGRPAGRALRPQLRVRHRQHRPGPAGLPDTGRLSATYTDDLKQVRLEGSSTRRSATRSRSASAPRSRARAAGIYYNPNQNKYYDHTDGYIVRGQIRYSSGPLDVNLMFDAQDMNLPTFANQWVVPAGKVATICRKAIPARATTCRPTSRTACTRSSSAAMLTANYDLGWATLTSTSMAIVLIRCRISPPRSTWRPRPCFQSLGGPASIRWAAPRPTPRTRRSIRTST